MDSDIVKARREITALVMRAAFIDRRMKGDDSGDFITDEQAIDGLVDTITQNKRMFCGKMQMYVRNRCVECGGDNMGGTIDRHYLCVKCFELR